MIFITGDVHATHDIGKLSYLNFPESKNLTPDDFVVILGDFGIPFLDKKLMRERGSLKEYEILTKMLTEKPYTILFIDGNHENFNFWDAQEITEKWGGKVQHHPDIPNAYRLMRGEIYEIDGHKIFTFGGAVSMDKEYRTLNVSYWTQEQATEDQIKHARENLKKHNNTVDFIFTHTMPLELIIENGYKPVSDRGAEYFDEILHTVNYKEWRCGHFHVDEVIEEYHLHMMYNQIERLDNTESSEINNRI